MKYSVNKAYPPLKVEKENEHYAKILLHNYADEISEETAIHLYLYQSLIIKNEKLAQILEQIAIVEMHHLKILGKTITLLGLKPVYGTIKNDFFKPWISTNVPYTTDIKQIFKTNIKMEKTAIKNYSQNLKLINDKYIQAIIKRIIEDELLHLKIFNDIYDTLNN